MAIQAPEQPPSLSLKSFTPRTPLAELNAFVESIRPLLSRVIVLFNGKGGQGKTSIASHLAGLLAELETAKAEEGKPAGRVLLGELDPQGNTLEDLGLRAHPDNDNGESLAIAVQYGQAPTIIRDAGGRPRLDVIPSGEELSSLPALMVAMQQKSGKAAWLGLAVMLARLANEYAWIILDVPPSTKENQQLALTAARWVITPVNTGDEASTRGLSGVAHRFVDVEDLNPDIELLGTAMFDFEHRYYTDRKTKEKRPVGLWVEVRAELEELLATAGSDAPVFKSVIRSAPRVAKAARKRGQLSYEVGEATDGITRLQKLKGEKGEVLPTERAEDVGLDYEDLAGEIVSRIVAIEAEEDAAA